MTAALSRKASHSMALVALFAALMAVMGLIPKIDLPLGVPITLQSLGVMLAGCLLGARRGFQSMLLFLAAVAAGLPLLSGGRGGLGVFMASAGYLVGYAPAAGVTGALMRTLPQGTPLRTAASAFIASVLGGLVFLHAMGIAGLVLLAQMPLDKAFLADLVFVPGDLVKCALCAMVVHTVAKALPDWPFGGRER